MEIGRKEHVEVTIDPLTFVISAKGLAYGFHKIEEMIAGFFKMRKLNV